MSKFWIDTTGNPACKGWKNPCGSDPATPGFVTLVSDPSHVLCGICASYAVEDGELVQGLGVGPGSSETGPGSEWEGLA